MIKSQHVKSWETSPCQSPLIPLFGLQCNWVNLHKKVNEFLKLKVADLSYDEAVFDGH